MKLRLSMLCVLGSFTCAGCGDSAGPSRAMVTDPAVQQQILDNVPTVPVILEATEVVAAQNDLRQEFDSWEQVAADEAKPLEQRQAALTSLTEHALEIAEIEQKPWGTVRKQMVDQESARVLRRLATESDEAEIRTQAIETLGQLKDVDGMDSLLDGLEDDSLEVREAAIGAVRNILSTNFGFHADDEPELRAEAVAKARRFWGRFPPDSRFVRGLRDPALLKQWKRQAANLPPKAKPGWEREDLNEL